MEKIRDGSKYRSARALAGQLLGDLAADVTVWEKYEKPTVFIVQAGNQDIEVSVPALVDDEKALSELLSLLAQAEAGRDHAKRLDALFYGSKLLGKA